MATGPLLVIIPDRLSELAKKGEITTRYYNPGELFDEVHLLLCNDDVVDPAMVQKTVGRAKLVIHTLCPPSIQQSWGWQPWRMKGWLGQGEELARRIGPALLRCHGLTQSALMAAHLRRAVGAPLVVSVHNEPDTDLRQVTPWWPNPKQRFIFERFRVFERAGLGAADRVVIVYEPQRAFVQKNGGRDIRLIYNVINPVFVRAKEDFTLHDPPRILCVGRQFKEKNPARLIRAMTQVQAHLTVVGDGVYHDQLVALAAQLGLQEKVTFLRAVANDDLCRQLPDFDLFATHNQYFGIPKAVIEPLLTGLPVVINRRTPQPVPELDGPWVRVVADTPQDYANAFTDLLGDPAAREALGRAGREYARTTFDPVKMEAQVVALYKELLKS